MSFEKRRDRNEKPRGEESFNSDDTIEEQDRLIQTAPVVTNLYSVPSQDQTSDQNTYCSRNNCQFREAAVNTDKDNVKERKSQSGACYCRERPLSTVQKSCQTFKTMSTPDPLDGPSYKEQPWDRYAESEFYENLPAYEAVPPFESFPPGSEYDPYGLYGNYYNPMENPCYGYAEYEQSYASKCKGSHLPTVIDDEEYFSADDSEDDQCCSKPPECEEFDVFDECDVCEEMNEPKLSLDKNDFITMRILPPTTCNGPLTLEAITTKVDSGQCKDIYEILKLLADLVQRLTNSTSPPDIVIKQRSKDQLAKLCKEDPNAFAQVKCDQLNNLNEQDVEQILQKNCTKLNKTCPDDTVKTPCEEAKKKTCKESCQAPCAGPSSKPPFLSPCMIEKILGKVHETLAKINARVLSSCRGEMQVNQPVNNPLRCYAGSADDEPSSKKNKKCSDSCKAPCAKKSQSVSEVRDISCESESELTKGNTSEQEALSEGPVDQPADGTNENENENEAEPRSSAAASGTPRASAAASGTPRASTAASGTPRPSSAADPSPAAEADPSPPAADDPSPSAADDPNTPRASSAADPSEPRASSAADASEPRLSTAARDSYVPSPDSPKPSKVGSALGIERAGGCDPECEDVCNEKAKSSGPSDCGGTGFDFSDALKELSACAPACCGTCQFLGTIIAQLVANQVNLMANAPNPDNSCSDNDYSEVSSCKKSSSRSSSSKKAAEQCYCDNDRSTSKKSSSRVTCESPETDSRSTKISFCSEPTSEPSECESSSRKKRKNKDDCNKSQKEKKKSPKKRSDAEECRCDAADSSKSSRKKRSRGESCDSAETESGASSRKTESSRKKRSRPESCDSAETESGVSSRKTESSRGSCGDTTEDLSTSQECSRSSSKKDKDSSKCCCDDSGNSSRKKRSSGTSCDSGESASVSKSSSRKSSSSRVTCDDADSTSKESSRSKKGQDSAKCCCDDSGTSSCNKDSSQATCDDAETESASKSSSRKKDPCGENKKKNKASDNKCQSESATESCACSDCPNESPADTTECTCDSKKGSSQQTCDSEESSSESDDTTSSDVCPCDDASQSKESSIICSCESTSKSNECDCCHCKALRRCEELAKSTKSPCDAPGDSLANDNKHLKAFIDSILMDLESMDRSRNQCETKSKVYAVTTKTKCIMQDSSFPVTILCVKELGVNSLYVKWVIHDCDNIAGYEIYVDGLLTNRYFNAKHETAVICDVSPEKCHEICLIAQPIVQDTCNDSQKWMPSVFKYKPMKASDLPCFN